MNDKAYWIWLQQALGYGVNTDEIVGHFENAKNVYFSTHEEKVKSGVFTAKQIKKLEQTPVEIVNPIIEDCRECKCRVLMPDDVRYPKSLKSIRNFPLVLYYRGNLDVLRDKMMIAIVGTRKASQTGLDVAGRLAASLVRSNAVVVSGGALGIDGAAHIGALSENGITVSVLGCGFMAKYRDSVANLKNEITEKGLIVTEYPPKMPPLGRNFPIRNRIISGISHGVVVVEGALGSGSLITARYAVEQGRELFAVPGDAIDSRHSGTMELIRSGATPVFSSADVLSQFEFTYPELLDFEKIERTPLYQNQKKFDFSKITYGVTAVYTNLKDIKKEEREEFLETELPKVSDEEKSQALQGNAKIVYDVLAEDGTHVDDILRSLPELGFGKVMSALTQLEMSGLIAQVGGKKYRRI